MILIAILAGTLIAGIGSVWIAALLSFGLLARYTQHMLSLAAGALLATAFLNLLPEAFESRTSPSQLFPTLLIGLIFFFLLDKAELWHHGHEHHEHGHGHKPDAHGHAQGHAHDEGHHDRPHGNEPAGKGGWAVLAGDSVHAFGDGVLIASAFMADIGLGVVAALAVLVHEVPHHMGDLIVLRRSSGNRRAAFVKVTLAGSVTALGGIAGYLLVDQLLGSLPFFLVVAASSFIYVALADLIPQLQRRLGARETATQIVWLLIGVGLVLAVGELAH
ncbi:MAG: ZIP family metal transporter [Polaromonas sp.]|nr:ZIP family metal transporter [Polaromonas sp.]